ncbi:hypothetical protein O181_111508 [Austropuccinia psidii MF-1]|uniref:Uncharacterized protein n=1 Tax=Austropuccinia psidii MF-1 TaxID=1389203 RepID=A0A9Q3JYN4_9BASI|nr:hypothetical protein [Austropuccinia psidii MF-1]
MEKNFIPLEAKSQDNPPGTPSDTEHMQKGKGNRNSESLILNTEWTPISTQRPRNPSSSASIQGSQTRGIYKHRSITSAPQTPQTSVPINHGKEDVQPGFTLGRIRGKLQEDISQRDSFHRPYGNHQML